MKKVILIVFILSHISAFTQSCLPEGITFSSQAQIDSFQVNYPGCHEIEGNVRIGDFFGNYDITNLEGLNVLTSIGGDLTVWKCHSLNNLIGLDGLTFINGEFKIDENNTLDSLAGLQNLDSIGGGFIIKENKYLTNLLGLNDLRYIGGRFELNDNLNLINFFGLSNLSAIGGDLQVYSNQALSDFYGLDSLVSIGDGLGIWGNDDLISLEALDKLLFVENYLEIVNNDKLTSLSGLENITGIEGKLRISHNDLLCDCEVQSICDYLSNPKGAVEIYYNAQGCNNPSEIADSCGFQLSCLPYGNYYFYTQEDIENFSSNYPGCVELEGLVWISEEYITSLEGLNDIISINGDLKVYSTENLTSLEGLENLQSVTGTFSIAHNDRLASTNGLNNLYHVGGKLDLYWNDSLMSLEGLENLSSAGGLFITHNKALSNLSDLSGLDSVDILYIQSNDTLSSISGLSNLRYVSKNLQIMANPYLSSLSGLENVEADSISLLYIAGNNLLSTCAVQSVCDYLSIPDANVHIESNASGCNTPEEVEIECDSSLCFPNGITFSTQAQIDSFPINYPYCTSIEGVVLIEGDDITNIDALIQVSHIGGDLIIGNNELLNSITGLSNLASLEGSLKIGYYQEVGGILILRNNPLLSSLSGIQGLDNINGELWIIGNLSLSNFAGLDNIISIDSNLYVWYNTNLDDMTSLSNLDSIGGTLSIQNNSILTSLLGLDSIAAASIENLEIFDNYLLSQCEVISVCEYLKVPGGIILIENNGSGCFDQDEVESACENFSISEQIKINSVSIYPNPAFNTVNIDTYGCEIDELCILTLTGQKVMQMQHINSPLDISCLQAGVYIIEVAIENTWLRKKLLVRR